MKIQVKVTQMFIRLVLIVLFTLVFGVLVTGCFESSSEDPPSRLISSSDNGGGGPLPGGNDTLRVPVDSSGGSVDVLRNDASGVVITAFDTTSSQGGTVSRNGDTGIFTYLPQPAYSGTDSFTYTIRDRNGNTSVVTVNVTVNNDIIISGRDYFNRECGICHKAGSEDQQSAFNATDLVLSSSNFDYDMSLSDQLWNPPLMLYYSNLSQKEVDGLRAYIGSLRNP